MSATGWVRTGPGFPTIRLSDAGLLWGSILTLLLCGIWPLPAAEPIGTRFKLSSTLVADGREATFEIYFQGYRAVEFEADGRAPLVVYHLARPMWQDRGTNLPVTIDEAERLAKEIARRSREALQQAAPQRALLESMMEPAFSVSEENGSLVVSNAVMRYTARGTTNVAPDVLDRVFQYDRLNAYRKAVTEQKAPPYPQLALDQELEARKLLPTNLSMVFSIPGRTIALELRNRLLPVSDEEAARVAKAVGR